MVYQIISLLAVTLLCILYMQYTHVYFRYCDYSLKTENYLVSQDKVPLYSALCKEMYRDYSNHTLLKTTINLFYDLFKENHIDTREFEYMINSIDYYSLKNYLKVLKLIHFFIYGIILYLLVLKFPIYFIKIVKYFLSKILLIVFFFVIIDAAAKIFLDIDIDFLQVFHPNFYSNSKIYLTITSVFGFLKNIIFFYK